MALGNKPRLPWSRTANRLAVRAIEAGATVTDRAGNVAWDVAGRCEAPVERQVQGVPSERLGHRRRDQRRPIARWRHDALMKRQDGPTGTRVAMTVRCRKCGPCRAYKAREWAHRAQLELKLSPRTWFCTFTVRPSVWQTVISRCRVREAKQGVDYDTLPTAERWRLLDDAMRREFTLAFKRFRKAGIQCRYVLVSEKHKSGLPHYHALIHEIMHPIRKVYLSGRPERPDAESIEARRAIPPFWPHGFTKFKLVDDASVKDAAWYVCKYIAKDNFGRVRASLHYGTASSHKTGQNSFTNSDQSVTTDPSLDTKGGPTSQSEQFSSGGKGAEPPVATLMGTDLKDENHDLSDAGLQDATGSPIQGHLGLSEGCSHWRPIEGLPSEGPQAPGTPTASGAFYYPDDPEPPF